MSNLKTWGAAKFIAYAALSCVAAVGFGDARAAVSEATQGPVGSSPEADKSSRVTNSSTLAEVVVTAQKREERLLDVPISIGVLNSDELSRLNATTSIEDLQFNVPGMYLSNTGDSRAIEIRGISNTLGGSPNVGVYLDEADVTTGPISLANLNTYDLDRVEVLRGPQGTLYGAGSAGGTVRFITKNPDLTQFTFDTDVAALFTQGGAPGERVQSAINLPAIDQVLGFRVAATFAHTGGWIDQPAVQQQNINGGDLTDVRIKGLWKPSSQLSVTALAEINRNNHGTSVGENPVGFFTQYFDQPTSPRIKEGFDIFNLTVTYNLGAFNVLNTTTYQKSELNSYNFGVFLPFSAPPSPPYEYIENPNLVHNNILTDEFRVSSTGSGPWQWTAGAFGQNSQTTYYTVYYFGLPGPLPPPADQGGESQSKNWAVFGNLSYKFGRLTLGSGIRRFHDEEQLNVYPPPTANRGAFESTDPRFYAQYALSDQASIYTSAAKGFRSGGFNAPGVPPYKPESIWTYEFGTKAVFLDNRLSANADVYYTDYTGYQVYGISPVSLTGLIANGGAAWIKGVEWDFAWRPSDRWKLSFNGNVLTSKFYKIDLINSPYMVGDNVDLTPEYLVTGSVEREFLFRGRQGFIRLDYSQTGKQTYRNRFINGPTAPTTPWWYGETNPIDFLNFNTGIEMNSGLSLRVFVQNVLNDRGWTGPNHIQVENYATRVTPRTLGVGFTAKFGER